MTTYAMNKKVWETLPKDIQAVFDELVLDYTLAVSKGTEEEDQLAYQAMKKAGVEIYNLPDTEPKKLAAKVTGIVSKWEKENDATAFMKDLKLTMEKHGLKWPY